jgi:hypothetical protein
MSGNGPDAEFIRIQQPPISGAGIADPKQIPRLQGVRHAAPMSKLTPVPRFNLLAHGKHRAGIDSKCSVRLNQCFYPFNAIRHGSTMPETRCPGLSMG